MQVTKTEIDALNAKLTIVVEPTDYEEGVQKQLKDIRRKANIPGFRPGMVPAGLVKKMYGKAVLGDEVNKVINEGIYNYVREQKLPMLAEPMPNDEETPAIDWDIDTTFKFVFDIALAPEFDAVPKAKLTYYEVEVSDEMIDNQIKSYASRFGTYDSVESYTDGDMLRGRLVEQKENGKTVESQVLSPAYMQDAEQKKLFDGVKKNDVVVFNPKKAYNNEAELASLLNVSKEEVATLDSDFAFTIETITHHNEAAVDQALFDKVYGEGKVKDEKDFRDMIVADLKENLVQDQNYRFSLDAKEAILKQMEDLQFPDAFLKKWLLKTNEKMTEEQIEKEFPQMIKELEWQLAVDKLSEKYKVEVKKEDVDAYAKEITRMQFLQYGLTHVDDDMLAQYAQEMLKNENQVRGIYQRVEENKVFEALKADLKVPTKSISQEEFNKLFS